MDATATLLVVENEASIIALVQMALERHGYVVLTAESGSEALRLAATHRGPIDLLISDVLPVPVDFIQKPFSPSALAAKVREVLDRHRSSRVEHT